MTHSTTRPIKVMHIIARLNIGGAAVYVIELVEQLNALGYDARLICGMVGTSEGDMRYIADERHVPVQVLPRLGREISFLGDLSTVFQLWRLMRRERPDIVHTHTAKAGLVGRFAAWLSGVPVIVHTFHGHVFAGYFGGLKTRLFLQLERLCARLSTRIVTLSPDLKRDLVTVYRIAPADKIEVIELGFDLRKLLEAEQWASPFRLEQNIPEDARLIGIVGRLVPIKNHELFFAAAKLVLEQFPAAYFAVVGDGERRTELEALAHALGIADHVRFTGWISDPVPVYAALDVLVLCSKNEGLPVSLIEAMAAGVPVVATAVGGVNDLLEGGRLGAIVPPDDAAALSGAILNILPMTNAIAAQKIAAAAVEAVRDRYDIGQSAAKTDALYRRLLHK
jgi:glycosyltransferase involved in cell wall biosynthesis